MEVDRDRIVAAAVRQTGLETFGDDSYVEGLDRLVAAIRADQALPAAAAPAIEQRLAGIVEQRLHLYADRRRYPEIAQQEIERPLIVIGLPRSGTTFLHALLAQDPASRSPLSWQAGTISPPPRRETIDTDSRIAETDAAQAGLPEDFKIMHLVGATLPEECNALLKMAFFSPSFGAAWDVQSYIEWFATADAHPRYALHRHMLQHLQAFTDGERWVLKAPPHMFHIAALIAAYPDAQIVFPHRDPAATLPSLTSLISSIRRWTYAHVDQATIGQQQMDMWAVALRRALASRKDPAQADRFVDVHYDRLIADPMGVVRSVYGHFGIPLTLQAQAAMQRFLAEKPKDKHGTHRYSLEDAGLSRAQVHARFAEYYDSYLAGCR